SLGQHDLQRDNINMQCKFHFVALHNFGGLFYPALRSSGMIFLLIFFQEDSTAFKKLCNDALSEGFIDF
ncbi:MAG: hypothetical protein AAFW00_29015, partial [Bacteroidota bacterium]